jgi:hypothetical protein
MSVCKQFDVGVSFSGNDRPSAGALQCKLTDLGVKTFYDHDFKPILAGEQLTEKLPEIYRDRCELFVPLISEDYRASVWARAEKRAALDRALAVDGFVLPIRLDDTDIPGISSTIGYLDARKNSWAEIADVIATKLLLKRVLTSAHSHDAVMVSGYAATSHAPVMLSAGIHKLPLGQAHVALNCVVAYERLISAHGGGSGSGAPPPGASDAKLVRAAQRIVNEACYEGPTYSLQVSVLDQNLDFVAHTELPPKYNLTRAYLPEPVKIHIAKLLSGTHDDAIHGRSFYWTDSMRSSRFPSDASRPMRSNIGYVFPNTWHGVGSGAPSSVAFVFGEIHVKWHG